MNIGITTFQWSNNYGAVIQAHALQAFLEQQGHTVQIVDYRRKPSSTGLKKILAKTPQGCIKKWEALYKEYMFESFRQKYLTRTTLKFYSVDEMEAIQDYFDVLITGSDQVWNPLWLSQLDGLFNLYFLSFAGPKVKRISYAASIGHSKTSTIKKDWQKILSEKLQQMNAISVREPSSIEIVNKLCGRTDAVQVVDPTLLLTKDYYYKKIVPYPKHHQKFLFSYMLHGLGQDAKTPSSIIGKILNLPVIQCDAVKTTIHKGHTLPSPIGWLRRIEGASFMVTNSFHGVVFCLIFHPPFVAVLIDGKIGSMNSRIVELLNNVGLPHRIIATEERIFDNLYNEIINWDEVDQKVDSMRIKSVDFLKEQGI